MKAKTESADCPRCGGYPEFDEEGRVYTCFFCCDTGSVSQAVADAFYREQDDAAEQFMPSRLGIFFRPMTDEYDWPEPGEECTPAPAGHRLFTRLIPAAPAARRAVSLTDEDIPF